MCGIAGIIGNVRHTRLVNRMLNSIKHRGPDAHGSYLDSGYCALGHNRLSIIDLNDWANQPFLDNDHRYALIFNGEIYNYLELRKILEHDYKFRTESDTEVLLASYIKWGEACLDKFIGMFSFAIWDSREKSLFAARDRFGVKPFNYYSIGRKFLFSSEIKALWMASVLKIPDENVWAGFLKYGSYGLPEQTFWKDIKQLPGGHYLKFDQKGLSVKKWYFFEDRIKNSELRADEKEIEETYYDLLKKSIELRLRSDVKLGINISGGLDSSTLLAVLFKNFSSKAFAEAYTFTTGNPQYDELNWVYPLIQLTSHRLLECRLKVTEIPDMALKMQYFQDEPFGGIPTLAYSQTFLNAKKNSCTVLLDGQGMDEAWAGYDYYQKQGENLIQGTSDSPVRPNCLDIDFSNCAIEINYPVYFDDAIQNLQFRDLFYTKIPRVLRFNDRISMQYSRELREPFLDHRLVEIAFALSPSLKINNGQRKWLLRKIVNDFLPPEISLAPKRALQTPQREWLKGPLYSWLIDNVYSLKNSYFRNWIKIDAILSEVENFKSGQSDNSFYLWQWISLALVDQSILKHPQKEILG